MGAGTTIEWTDVSWPLVNGCRRKSEGCRNCYAEQLTATRLRNLPKYQGLAVYTPGGPRWTGETRLWTPDLALPLRRRTPSKIFVADMGDLFFEGVSDETIALVCGAMLLAGQHTYQILTKRPERMARFFVEHTDEECIALLADKHPMLAACGHAGDMICGRCMKRSAEAMRSLGRDPQSTAWPPPWWWLGVSAEDQGTWNERVPVLVHECPGSMKWVSAEPMLGPIKLRGTGRIHLSWLVCGGESGRNARPFDVAWARSLVKECRDVGLAVFVKQLGSNLRDRNDVGFDGQDGDAWDVRGDLDRVEHNPDGVREEYQGAPVRVRLLHSKGGDPAEWPEDLRVREFPR